MSESVLATGDKLHVMTRRLYSDDVHPHFICEVAAASGSVFSAIGYSFVFDSGTNSYIKHPTARTRVFSLSNAGYIVTLIPTEVELNELSYRVVSGRLVVTDGRDFSLEINEFGQSN